MRAFFRPGRRGPIHASGIGKAILSTWADAEIEQPFQRPSPCPLHRKHPRHPAQAACRLRSIRTRGWSIDDEEHTLGMCCLAAPIFNEYGEAIAGISVSGPAVRLPDAQAGGTGAGGAGGGGRGDAGNGGTGGGGSRLDLMTGSRTAACLLKKIERSASRPKAGHSMRRWSNRSASSNRRPTV